MIKLMICGLSVVAVAALTLFGFRVPGSDRSCALEGACEAPAPTIALASSLESPDALPPFFDAVSSRTVLAVETDESEEPRTSGSPCRFGWSSRNLARQSSHLAQQLREGNADLSGVIDLASSLVESVETESPEPQKDGSTQYKIAVPEELGVATLHVRPGESPEDRQYEIVVRSKESEHELVSKDFALGTRLEIRLGFEEGQVANHCSAFSLVEPLPSNDLYQNLMGSDWITIGGSLSANPDSCVWRPVRMLLLVDEGVYSMRQEVSKPVEQIDRLDEQGALSSLALTLAAL